MHVVEYLKTPGKSLTTLTQEFGIKTRLSDGGRWVILNYDQVESKPKDHPVIMDCRGLTLEVDTWKVVGRSFRRFFNLGECPEQPFDWSEAWVQEKVDGSLITVYRCGRRLMINTRGTFGDGLVDPKLADWTWDRLFWATGVDDEALNDILDIHGNVSLVFELCSPLNKNVRTYEKPTLFLLTIVNNETGIEFPAKVCDRLAESMKASRPREFGTGLDSDVLAELIVTENDPTFEGFVLRDHNGQRRKCKNPKYVALHHLKGNGTSICSPKYLIPFILDGAAEEDEVLKYLPELRPYYHALTKAIDELLLEILTLWNTHHKLESQKDFALAVKHSKGSGFLFEARKRGVSPLVVWHERAAVFLERWAEDNVKVPPAPPPQMVIELTEDEAKDLEAVLAAPPGSPGKLNCETARVPEVSSTCLSENQCGQTCATSSGPASEER